MEKMNKRGELFLVGIIFLAVLVAGIVAYEGKIEDKSVVADKISRTAYNLKSENATCLLQNVSISRDEIELFNSMEEAVAAGYKADETCR